ncbi:MAG: LysR family transcriptional regulator [Burkholderiales bacterium]|nr:LysR family transcriptional regulator [Burkholderiales bacterium]
MRAPPLDLRLLEVFEAIHIEKSLTNAALRLAMTQPAVSQSLTKMRAHFGDQLFVRTAAGMEPTPRAKELFASVSVILREARESLVARPAFDPRVSEREFVIATTDLGAAALIPPLVAAARERAPLARLVSVNADGRDLGEELAGGDVSLAIGNFPVLQAGIYQQGLYQESYALLASRERAAAGCVTVEEFREARHVIVSAGSSGHFHAEIEKRLAAMIPPDHVAARVSSFLVAPLVARGTDLLLTVPRRVAAIYAPLLDLEEMPLPLELPDYPITQYWHARFHHDPAIVWLRGLVFDLFSDGGARAQPAAAPVGARCA